jgi:biopolymer transport protein ExbD
MKFHRPTRTRSQVPIVPMIDILFILLVYVIVTTETKKPRDVLRIELPTVREVASDQLVDARSVLAVDAEGQITLDSVMVPEGLLENYLVAFQKNNPGRKLELKPDGKVSLERMLSVWDALVASGIAIGEVPARIRRAD